MTQTPRWIAVTGVGRSGTSLAMQVLEGVGARVSADVVPPSDDNPEGFLEATGVVDVHDGLVTDLGVDPVVPLPADWADRPEVGVARRSLTRLVRGELDGDAVWAVKDPRIGLLWPLWAGVADDVGHEPAVVWCTRESSAVAASLRRAYGLDPATAEGLIVTRSLQALESLPERTCFLPYAGWQHDPQRQLAALATATGLAMDDAARAVVAARVRADLDRSSGSGPVLSGALRDLDALQRELVGRASDRDAIASWCRDVRASSEHLAYLTASAASRGVLAVRSDTGRQVRQLLRSATPAPLRARVRTVRRWVERRR